MAVVTVTGQLGATWTVPTRVALALRYRRAVSERRRFFELRRATEELIAKVRYLNQVSISMRAGLLDAEGAAQEDRSARLWQAAELASVTVGMPAIAPCWYAVPMPMSRATLGASPRAAMS